MGLVNRSFSASLIEARSPQFASRALLCDRSPKNAPGLGPTRACTYVLLCRGGEGGREHFRCRLGLGVDHDASRRTAGCRGTAVQVGAPAQAEEIGRIMAVLLLSERAAAATSRARGARADVLVIVDWRLAQNVVLGYGVVRKTTAVVEAFHVCRRRRASPTKFNTHCPAVQCVEASM